jgi:uncharacterized membrane protein YkgB
MKTIEKFDAFWVHFFREKGPAIGRISLFVIFFWFGILKVLGLSPAGPLVTELFRATFLGSITQPDSFLVFFGWLEMVLGVMILIPKLERITFALLGFHLVTTVMPLFILGDSAWKGFLVPTLVGQYIIKNAALLSLGVLIFAELKPMSETHSIWGENEE